MYDRFYYTSDIDKAKQNAIANAKTEFAWILCESVDYTNFNLRWVPNRFERSQSHTWGSHNNANSHTTWLLPVNLLRDNNTIETNFHNLILPSLSTAGWTWITDERVDYSNFNFDWLPDSWDWHLTHCFAMQGTEQLSFTQLVNTKSTDEKKFHKSNLKFNDDVQGQLTWPNFVDTMLTGADWQDSLANCVLSQDLATEWIWITDSRIDYAQFDFSWMPEPWDHDYIHCFTMKNQEQLSYTWLINRNTIKNKQFKYIKTDLKFKDNLHCEEVYLDMGNVTGAMLMSKRVRYTGRMEDVLRNAVKRCTKEWMFVASSCANYEEFNFSWLPDLDQIHYTHCWPAPGQVKGETFLIHIPSFRHSNEFIWNFEHPVVKRYPWPGIIYKEDNIADAINLNERHSSLYTVYYKRGSRIHFFPTPCLWEQRPVIGMSLCNSVSLVPRDCIVEKEIYEYPHLERTVEAADGCKMDIIFLHNNEAGYLNNYDRLNHRSYDIPYVVKGITPRLKAYQTAANKSNTDWFLAVFAKCWMTDNFVQFKWRPDYWQQAKHYIFHNYNKDLDLTYGHMAPIAYNKRLMLENTGGLDMTLAQEHAVIPEVISQTELTDPWDIWRTAFRETVKLLYYAKNSDNIELHYRLDKWLTAEQLWYKRGAEDAQAYFESIDGDYAWIMLTSEWDWLRKRFNAAYAADLTVSTI
jgi:hypothetical protein